jgi:hypothetical protein
VAASERSGAITPSPSPPFPAGPPSPGNPQTPTMGQAGHTARSATGTTRRTGTRNRTRHPREARAVTDIRGGQGAGASDSGLTLTGEAVLDRRAIANGWLRRPDGSGLDAEKMARLIQRNIERALDSEDDRAVAALTRNVIAAVGQVMEEEQRQAGGPTLNVSVGAMTEAEKAKRVRAILTRHGVGPALPAAGGGG